MFDFDISVCIYKVTEHNVYNELLTESRNAVKCVRETCLKSRLSLLYPKHRLLSTCRTLRRFLQDGKSELSSYRFAAFTEYQAMLIDPIRNLSLDTVTVHDTILGGSAKVALNDLMAKISPHDMFVFVLYSKVVPGFAVDILLVDDPNFAPKTMIELDLNETEESDSSDDEFSAQMGEVLINDDGTVERNPDAKPISEGATPKRSVMACTLNSTGEVKTQGTMTVGSGESKVNFGPSRPTSTYLMSGKHSAPDQASGYTGRSKSGHAPGFVLN